MNNAIRVMLAFVAALALLVPSLAAELPTQVDDVTWDVPIRSGITYQNGNPLELTVEA